MGHVFFLFPRQGAVWLYIGTERSGLWEQELLCAETPRGTFTCEKYQAHPYKNECLQKLLKS